MGCFSGHLMSAASNQKLFCNLCSPFCCSFDEFVEEKVISSSYSSAILTPPPASPHFEALNSLCLWRWQRDVRSPVEGRRGPIAFSRVSTGDSDFPSSCEMKDEPAFKPLQGNTVFLRDRASRQGILFSYEGHLRNLFEAWQGNRHPSRGEA